MPHELNPLNPDLEKALESISFDKGLRGQLESVRKMTELTGQVYDLQISNLKMWPWVIFPLMKKNEFTINTDSKEIVYDFTFKSKKKLSPTAAKKQKKSFAILDAAIRKLLGRDWLVVMRLDGHQVYRREKLVRPNVDFGAAVPIGLPSQS